MTTVEKMKQKLDTAKKVHNLLHKEIMSNGGGATGATATMFCNADKDLISIKNKVRNLLANEDITIEEYKYILSI